MYIELSSTHKKLALGGIITAAVLWSTAAFAWTGPTASPPASNATTPINAGSQAQSKVAGLVLNTGNAANGLIVQYGNVGIDNANPSYALDVTGTVRATAFLYASDRTLKTDIAPLSDALSKVEALQGVSFTWKDSGKPAIGLIAQDVQQVYPQAVEKDTQTGLLSVAYGNLIAPVIEAVKALAQHDNSQDAEIQALQTTVASQAATIAQLKKEVQALQNR